jgi:hypothetical protein
MDFEVLLMKIAANPIGASLIRIKHACAFQDN